MTFSTKWGVLAALCCMALFTFDVYATNTAAHTASAAASAAAVPEEAPSSITFVSAPDAVETALDHLSTVLLEGTGTFELAHLRALAAFTQAPSNHGVAWTLRTRWDSSGAATVSALDLPFATCITSSYSTNIPDYSLLPCSLRYSEDGVNSTGAFMRCIAAPAASNTVVHASFLCREETTPNPQSGTAYTYTTRRHLIRAMIDGVDILMSFSDMQGKSSYARRGVPVGPLENDVYYYSERTGTNLRGLQWVKPRMNLSRSLVVWTPSGSNKTVFAAFSWVNAGWRGLNVTRTHHIYEVLEKILATRHVLACSPAMTEHNTAAAVARILNMNTNQINNAYAQYCAYVKHWRDIERSQAGLTALYQPNALMSMYDEGELAQVPFPLRQALVVQEELRTLRGTPTWSAQGATTNKPARSGWSRFLHM